MAHVCDLFDTGAPLNLSHRSRKVINTVFRPVHGPELAIIDSVLVIDLGVLDARVIGQVDVKAHLCQLESHWLDIIRPERVKPALARASHTMLHDDSRFGHVDRTILSARDVEHCQCVAIIGMKLDRLPSHIVFAKASCVLWISINFFLGLRVSIGK